MDDDLEQVWEEIGRVKMHVEILQNTVLPLLGGMLSDSVRGETLQDRLSYIQNIRHRVRSASLASVDETPRQTQYRQLCLQQIDALFDQVAGSLADAAFESDDYILHDNTE